MMNSGGEFFFTTHTRRRLGLLRTLDIALLKLSTQGTYIEFPVSVTGNFGKFPFECLRLKRNSGSKAVARKLWNP